MSQPNPFLNRGSLAGLIAKRNQVNSTMEGASPFMNFMARQKARQVDEAINQYGRHAMQPRPMQPQPMMRPQPMPQQPMPVAPMPAMPAPMPSGPGVMSSAPGGFGANVTVSGGGGMPSMPQMMPQGGGWNALGLGGFDPSMLQQQRGFGYGGYGGGFGGFSAAQPYRPAGGGGFARLF